MISRISDISVTLSQDLWNENLQGRTLKLKLKTAEFRAITRSRTLNSYIWNSIQIFSISKSVYYISLNVDIER